MILMVDHRMLKVLNLALDFYKSSHRFHFQFSLQISRRVKQFSACFESDSQQLLGNVEFILLFSQENSTYAGGSAGLWILDQI